MHRVLNPSTAPHLDLQHIFTHELAKICGDVDKWRLSAGTILQVKKSTNAIVSSDRRFVRVQSRPSDSLERNKHKAEDD